MTRDKQLKSRIRARMAKTGERYTTARAHLIPASTDNATGLIGTTDLGYRLRGGIGSDTSAITNILANLGVTRQDGSALSEPLVFAASGGIGAGYILWEFAQHDARILTLWFNSRAHYPQDWLTTTLDRLQVPYDVHTTSGAKGAAARLSEELAAGRPVIVLPDCYLLGYWQLPAYLEAHGGHFIVAYGQSGDRVHVDDRNLAPLTVARPDFDAARQRVVSYKNLLVSPRPNEATILDAVLATAVHDGLRQGAELLAGSSKSFALPAWLTWSKRMTDERNAKGWPRVFADGRGLVGALLSTWEGVEPVGMTGGNFRGLFADALDESAELLGRPQLRDIAPAWRAVAEQWHRLADTALPDQASLPRMRELTATIAESLIADGDEGAAVRATAAEQLWRLRADADTEVPLDAATIRELFAAMGQQLQELYDAERAAVDRVQAALS